MRLPLTVPLENRDDTTAKDARMVNLIAEKRGTTYGVRKRPGLSAITSPPTGVGYGTYNWNGVLYNLVGTTLYAGATSAATGVSGTGAGLFSFSETKGGTPRLVFKSNTAFNVFDGTAYSNINQAFLNNTVPGVVYLDGYTFVMGSNRQINNSGIDDPTTWNSLDFITAEIEPGTGIAIAKHLNYVTAFTDRSVEFFYDAANSTGSPLLPFSGNVIKFGCAYGWSVAGVDGITFWVAQSRSGGLFVAQLTDLHPTPVSNAQVELLLENTAWTQQQVTAFAFRTSGHIYYMLTLGAFITLIYDASTQLWYEWYTPGNSIMSASGQTLLNNTPVIQDTSGQLHTISAESSTDNGSVIVSDLYTPIFDGGTTRIKRLGLLELVGDKQPSSTVNINWSDDDYTTWTTPLPVDMSVERSTLRQLGSFRRRSFHLNHASATPLWIEHAELGIAASPRDPKGNG